MQPDAAHDEVLLLIPCCSQLLLLWFILIFSDRLLSSEFLLIRVHLRCVSLSALSCKLLCQCYNSSAGGRIDQRSWYELFLC
ncbi:hypothetical protein KC19_12G169300 [Ceratodon purpureus]|uniref:Uncharacterized protein n=1 Tax=Ceratodon purpureus TaxID=3225 RepID=A0A8T0G8Q9_CERPU|nr:hypothetical protein KC19_12G169300 [Ceratodon purpureus]